MGLKHEEASELHHRYVRAHPSKITRIAHYQQYTQYGLALRGLVRHHEVGEHHLPLPREFDSKHSFCQIDPLDFNEKCDGSLPLEEMIKPDPSIRKLFEDIDRTKVCTVTLY